MFNHLKGLDGEIWKEYKEGLYISNFGRVIKETTLNGRGFNPRILDIKQDKGYIRVKYYKKKYYIHRLVGLLFIPNPENKPTIDHINPPDTFNNIIGNLRWATQQEQSINRRPYGNSGYKNIRILKNGNYNVEVRRKGKHIFNKTFKTLEEAIKERDKFLSSIN